MLTLSFPYTHAIAGKVYRYTATPDLAEAWEDLTKRHVGENKNLPYADLTRALRFVLGDFAGICRGPDRVSTFVLTRQKAPDGLLARLFGHFEADLARRHNAPFDNLLAPLVDSLTPTALNLGDELEAVGPTGEPDIPSWVYDVVTWHAAELLAARPLRLTSGRELTLRLDTDGNLIAWNDLLPAPGVDQRKEPAMHYLSLSALTLAGHRSLILSVDAHISRLTYFFPNSRSGWLATDQNRPLLNCGFHYDRKFKRRSLRGITGELVDSFSLRGIPTELGNDILTAEPDRLRARHHSTPKRHAVGSGPGRKFLDAVLTHTIACLPTGTAPLELADSGIRNIDRDQAARVNPETPADRIRLAATLAHHERRLDLTVLFATDQTRARAASTIAAAAGVEPQSFDTNGELIEILPNRLRVQFVYASKDHLLNPGDSAQRIALAEAIHNNSTPGSDWRRAVFAETSKELALADGVASKHDPKRQFRRELARYGIFSQFLDTDSAPRRAKEDFPADNAFADLLRTAGLTGTLPGRTFDSPLQPGPAVLVGIHSRGQNRPANRLISLAAAVTHGAGGPWETLGYHPDAGGWNDYSITSAAHHATVLSPFGSEMTYSARIRKAAGYAHRALEQLLVRYAGYPIVLFVDGVGCRNLWSGLANRTYGLATSGALPHLGLTNAEDNQVALIRVVTNDDGELFQPARASGVREGIETNELVPASTKLYRLPNSNAETYYLINRSRTDQAFQSAVRESHRKTRFDVTEKPATLKTPWHSMTCTEFAVVDAATWTSAQLGALAARLCGNPLIWDGRTSRPLPLHMARQVTEDHPDRT